MNIHIIPVTPLQENCSLLVCQETNRAALVDPGGDSDVIRAALEDTGARLEKILVTHAHADHIGAVSVLRDLYQVPVEGPNRGDAALLSLFPEQKARLGLDEGEVFTPDRWFDGGETTTFGAQTLSVLYVPGHTPGHVAYFHSSSRVAFVGDVLFAGSIGRTDLPGGDFRTLIASIRDTLLPLGDDVVFVPGHGPESTLGRERLGNPFLRER
ncbi:MBL fold metallo-hydrolase [Phaeovibrio sulfidiphilus]|uniref:MBL fold metallo-hydrolase n=2 Tax=Phaeovibrio sulfidiphilus TaxID=1220600 RepID=A0A8J6YW14_9PROT|nr:MBL fold metallo-hydrolase [Phaeovibrio sulfidiphilus]